MLYFIFLQIGSEEVASMVGEYYENTTGSHAIAIVLIILLIINIVCSLIKFIMDLCLKKEDVKIFRKNEITKISIKIESDLYSKLLKLSMYVKDENHKMLDDINMIQTYVGDNKIYISKEIEHVVIDLIDYFTRVCGNFNNKDLKQEEKLFNKYREIYHG